MLEIFENRIKLDDGYEIREYMSNRGNIRTLYNNNAFESLTYTSKKLRNELCDDYIKFYNLPVDLYPNGNNYLVLGGGTFSYPKFYISKYFDKKMTVVEINKNCIEMAMKYFYLDELLDEYDKNNDRLNIVIDDAIKYIKKCDIKFDYIFIDLFCGVDPVSEIYKDDNLNSIKKLLNNNGVIIVNYIISENNLDYYKDHLSKLIKITTNYKIISSQKYFSDNMGNILIILSNNVIDIPDNYEFININLF